MKTERRKADLQESAMKWRTWKSRVPLTNYSMFSAEFILLRSAVNYGMLA